LAHGLLECKPAIDRAPRSIRTLIVEPARDRVAGEADYAAAKALDLGDQGGIDVDLRHQRLGAAAGAEGAVERLNEGREAGNIGEERRASGVLR
jgi:hypothetical protein